MKAGWPVKKLGDLCQTGSGGTPLKAKKEYYEGGIIPWLLSGEVSQGEVREATKFITQKGLEESAAKIFPKDTVLVAMYGATAGQVGILRFEAATNQAVCGIFPSKHVVPEFLFYLFLSRKDELVAQAAGNAQPNISQIKIRNTGVPVVPIPEQRRIVGILDEAFEGIATAKGNAEKNLQNARAVFESHLNAVFTQRGEGWVEKRLAEICVLQRGFDLPTRSRVPGDFPLVSSSGVIDSHNEGPVSGPGVATGRSGSIGNVFYIEDDYWPLNTVLYVKEFHGNYPKFVYRLLSHFDLRRFATGAGVPTLNRNFVHDERVVVPESKTVQKKIAEQFDGIEQETRCLESIYRQKLSALEELKKSLLHQAFTGVL